MEEIKYQHFLVTRFNLKQDHWVSDKNNNSLVGITELWLKKRFKLFETYCLPSVKSQINKNFKWLVYFDIDTSEDYRARIRSYEISLPNFVPKFIQGWGYFLDSVKYDISVEYKDTSSGVVITTRLDNDDSLHESFIEEVQSFIKSNHIVHGVVDVPYGYCLQIEPKHILTSYIQFSNPFVTYIEPYVSTNTLLTVFKKKHTRWIYSDNIYFINNKRLWMQVIHENNISNEIHGKIVNNEERLIRFNINGKVKFQTNAIHQILYYNYIKFPIYFLKQLVKKFWVNQTKRKQRILKSNWSVS